MTLNIKKYLLTAFLINILSVLFAVQTNAAAPIPNKTMKLVIKKIEIDKPIVSDLQVENIPPEDYRVVLPNDFYKLTIIDGSDATLYTGWVLNKIVLPPDPINPNNYVGGLTELKYPIITINLPYYQEAKFIRLYDESNKLLLEIPLGLYGFPDAAQHFAECDNCGYCKYGNAPSNWEKCRACLYPNASTDPLVGDTLKIDGATGLQIEPEKGHAFTELGCIVSEGFETESGRASTTRFVLRVVMGIVGALALFFLSYGAFLVATAKDNIDQVSRGKRIIIRTVIGVIIALLGVFIINTIANGVLKIPGMGK